MEGALHGAETALNTVGCESIGVRFLRLPQSDSNLDISRCLPHTRCVRKYTRELLEKAVLECRSWSDLCRYFHRPLSGGTQQLIKSRVLEYGIPTDHFLGMAWSKGQPSHKRKKADQVLIKDESRLKPPHCAQLRRSLLEVGVSHSCSVCGQGSVWNGRPLVLQVDHVNGNRFDNRLENLRFMCPNCHTQTDNWGSVPRQPRVKAKVQRKYHSKIDWPSKEALAYAVWVVPVDRLAEFLGVSGTAVKKRCVSLGIKTPSRGYWSSGGSAQGGRADCGSALSGFESRLPP